MVEYERGTNSFLLFLRVMVVNIFITRLPGSVTLFLFILHILTPFSFTLTVKEFVVLSYTF